MCQRQSGFARADGGDHSKKNESYASHLSVPQVLWMNGFVPADKFDCGSRTSSLPLARVCRPVEISRRTNGACSVGRYTAQTAMAHTLATNAIGTRNVQTASPKDVKVIVLLLSEFLAQGASDSLLAIAFPAIGRTGRQARSKMSGARWERVQRWLQE